MIPFSINPPLPIRKGPARFAVGPPDGITSNSWKCWVTKSGVYIACRDNFREAKVSLHTSGRWRMGFIAEATKKYPNLIPANRNRAWRVWDEPPAQLPNTVMAFRLMFPTSELGVMPEQRSPKEWQNVKFIEPAPVGSGKMVVVSLFVTKGEVSLRHESEPSIWLASFEMAEGRRAQLIAHGEAEGDFPQTVGQSNKLVIKQGKRESNFRKASTAISWENQPKAGAILLGRGRTAFDLCRREASRIPPNPK